MGITDVRAGASKVLVAVTLIGVACNAHGRRSGRNDGAAGADGAGADGGGAIVEPDGGRPDAAALDTPAGAPFSGEYADPSAPPDVKDAFLGIPSTDPASRPALVYPLAGAMLGSNIGGMNLQWRAGPASTLFRVRIKGERGEVQIYAGQAACPSGKCRLAVPDDFWRMIAAANAGARIALTIDGVAAPGDPVSSTDVTDLWFSPEALRGGLYYFSTKLPGIMRVRLGDTTPEPFIAPASPANPYKCVGCHTLTRDGCRMAFTYEGGDGHLGIAAATDGTLYLDPARERSNFQTWNPDGTRLMTLKTGELILRDNAGALVARVPRSHVGPTGNDSATHPEWSPDGEHIAFTRLAKGSTVHADWTHSGDIMLLPYLGGAFAAATVLVGQSGADYHYYPHFSPDSKWVVFNTGTRPGMSPAKVPATNLASYDQTSSRLRLVAAAGGTPIDLGNATAGMNTTASWPKFSPFAQGKGSLFFIVYSSRLDYGFLLEQATVKPQSPSLYGRPQMWVAAIDVTKPGDPSYAPFWLPFQLTTEGTHLGYWTTQIAGSTVGSGDCR